MVSFQRVERFFHDGLIRAFDAMVHSDQGTSMKALKTWRRQFWMAAHS
jgi:hypothetical protein